MHPRLIPSANALYRLTREAARHTCTLFLSLVILFAQPASITTHAIPASGTTIFDSAGNAYVTGATKTASVTTPGAAQTQPGGGTCGFSVGTFGGFATSCSDAFILKTDRSGNVIFGTLLGGPTGDNGAALAVDRSGNAFIAGSTGGQFPTTTNSALASSATSRGFAAKVAGDGSQFLYSTYLPNSQGASAIAIDSQGNAYVAGETTANHAQIMKISADGSTFLYNITIAGSGMESVTSIAVDSAANAYITGWTTSPNFPVTANAPQSQLAGKQNAFVAKLDPNGNVVFSTYLGGGGTDDPTSIQLDSAQNIYIAGRTTSLDFPITQGARIVPLWNIRGPGGFIAKLSASFTIAYSTYAMILDHPLNTNVFLSVSTSGEAYLASSAGAGLLTTPSAPQICFGGATDAFVLHLDATGAIADATYIGGLLDDLVNGFAAASDGSLQLAWWSQGNQVVSQFRFSPGGATPSPCLSPDALNSATMHSQGATGGAIAPGEFVTLTGYGIGPGTASTSGVQVLFNGQAAPILYAQARQINVQAPLELAGETSTTIAVQYNGAIIGPITVPVIFGVPGIFRLQPGVSTQAAALNQDGTINSSSNPAARGSIIALYGTGFGPTSPACPTGGISPLAALHLAPGLSGEIDIPVAGGFAGEEIPAYYAGSAPTLLCGVNQVNFSIPSNAAPGPLFFTPGVVMTTSNGGGTNRTFNGSTVGPTIFVK